MSESLTPRLGLIKPTPGTAEPIDVTDHLNFNWDVLDSSIGATACTSGTRPATPYDGQLIRETDTRRMYVWNDTEDEWDQLVVMNSTITGAGTGSTAKIRSYLSSGAAAGNRFLGLRGSGDANDRYLVDHDGAMQWGPGSAVADTSLSRVAVGRLQLSGQLRLGTAVPVEVMVGTSDTTTSTTYTALTSHGTSFIAPPSGAVWIDINGHLGTNSTDNAQGAYMSFEVRSGGTVGSGTVFQAAGDGSASFCRPSTTSGFKYIGASVRRLVTGLTAGSTYNVRTMVRTTSATYSAAIQQRYLSVDPVSTV